MKRRILFLAPAALAGAFITMTTLSSCGDTPQSNNLLTSPEKSRPTAQQHERMFPNERYIEASDALINDPSSVIRMVSLRALDQKNPSVMAGEPVPGETAEFHFINPERYSLRGIGVHQLDLPNYSRYKLENGEYLEHIPSGPNYSLYRVVPVAVTPVGGGVN